MTTALDIATRAYRKLGISGPGDTLTAEELAEGIDALNAMIHAWKLAGVDTTHADLSADDDFPLGPEYVEGTVYLLAARLSPDYVTPASFDADDWFRKFQAAYMVIDTVPMTQFERMPSQFVTAKRSRFF
jgi:hypothetical protein